MTTIPRELESEKVYADEIDASEGRLDKIRAAKKLRKSKKGANGNADDDDIELGDSGPDFGQGIGSDEDADDNTGSGATTARQSLEAGDTSGTISNEEAPSKSEVLDIEKGEAGDPTKVLQGTSYSKKDDEDSENNVTMGKAVSDKMNKSFAVSVHKESPKKKPLDLQEQEPIVQLSFYIAVVSFALACLVALVMIILLSTVGA